MGDEMTPSRDLRNRLAWGIILMAVSMLLGSVLKAQDIQPGTPKSSSTAPDHSTLYKWSCVSLVAANGMDAASSWNKRELNPILGQTFAGRAIAIKAGGTAGVLVAQYFVLRRHPQAHKSAAIVNFAVSGVLGGIAARNFRIQSKP